MRVRCPSAEASPRGSPSPRSLEERHRQHVPRRPAIGGLPSVTKLPETARGVSGWRTPSTTRSCIASRSSASSRAIAAFIQEVANATASNSLRPRSLAHPGIGAQPFHRPWQTGLFIPVRPDGSKVPECPDSRPHSRWLASGGGPQRGCWGPHFPVPTSRVVVRPVPLRSRPSPPASTRRPPTDIPNCSGRTPDWCRRGGR